jgi:hypothetical protein
LKAEAYAAHIGQFIHNGGKLDTLRKELPKIEGIKWFEIETGKKTPVVVKTHHTSEQLFDIHEKLASIHREYEQKVNYYKSMVKNLVTSENSIITKNNKNIIDANNVINEKLRHDYNELLDIWNNKAKVISAEFEEKRQVKIQENVNLKITVDPIFQDVINDLLVTEK